MAIPELFVGRTGPLVARPELFVGSPRRFEGS